MASRIPWSGSAPDHFAGPLHLLQSLAFCCSFRWSGTRVCGRNPNLRADRTARPGANLWPARPGRRPHAGERARVGDGIGLAQRYPASNEFKAATVEPYALAGCGRSSGQPARDQHPAQPGGSGARDRVPEHLRHDAGPRRQPRARAVHSRGARRGPAASHPAPVLRSDLAGVCRGALSAFVLFGIPAIGWMVSGRAGSSGGRFRRRRCRDLDADSACW